MADEIVLYNRQARAPATAERGTAVLLGILLTAIGVALGLASLGYVPVSGATSPSAVKLIALFAVNMVIAGGLFLTHGARGIRRLQRVTTGQQERATQPWLWDYRWDPRGRLDESPRNALRAFLTGMIFLLCLLPASAILLVRPGIPKIVIVFIAFFDILFLIPFVQAIYLTAQVVRSGRVRASFRSFPFRLGAQVAVDLQLPGRIRDLPKIEARLICIDERFVSTGTDSDRSTSTTLFQVYTDARDIVVRQGPNGTAQAEVIFELPAGDYATMLSRVPPRYWQLELHAERPGIDYDVKLLLPIY